MQMPEIYEDTKKSVSAPFIQNSIIKMAEFMPPRNNEVILDYGSGAGSTCAKYLLPQNPTAIIHGVDISQEMVTYANTHYPHPRVTYHLGDIMDNDDDDEAPWKKIKYDKIVSMYVLHFIRDMREALKRLFKLLKPGGLLGFLVTGKGIQFPLYRILGQDPRFAPYLKGFQIFIPKWFEDDETGDSAYAQKFVCDVANEIGFNVKWSEVVGKSHVNQNLDNLTEHFYSLMLWIKNVPPELHDEIRTLIRQSLCQLNQCDVNSQVVNDRHESLTIILERPLQNK